MPKVFTEHICLHSEMSTLKDRAVNLVQGDCAAVHLQIIVS